MTNDDTATAGPAYTVRDVETYLSHLADWYRTDRTGEQDVLDRPEKAETQLHSLALARRSMRLNGNEEKEFTRAEALRLFEWLKRRRSFTRDGRIRIKPERLMRRLYRISRKMKSETREPPC